MCFGDDGGVRGTECTRDIRKALGSRKSRLLLGRAGTDQRMRYECCERAIAEFLGKILQRQLYLIESALAYATRIVALRRGRVIFDGAPSTVTPAVVAEIYGEAPA